MKLAWNKSQPRPEPITPSRYLPYLEMIAKYANDRGVVGLYDAYFKEQMTQTDHDTFEECYFTPSGLQLYESHLMIRAFHAMLAKLENKPQ
jgi:hypothetical protein